MGGNLVRTAHDDLTYQIIGCAMAVHRNLGPGLRENSYQRALEVVLAERAVRFEPQKLIPVSDGERRQAIVGYYIPDFIIEGAVIVEIRALNGLDAAHLAQVIGYLAVTRCRVGLLINFGKRSLEWRRVFPPLDVSAKTINRQWLFVPDSLRAGAASQSDGLPNSEPDAA